MPKMLENRILLPSVSILLSPIAVFQNKLVTRASEQSLSAASAQGVVARRMETRLAFPREKHFLPASNTAIYSGHVQVVT